MVFAHGNERRKGSITAMGLKILRTKKKHGNLEVASVLGLFYHPEHDLTVCCHGDDFLASGEKEALGV